VARLLKQLRQSAIEGLPNTAFAALCNRTNALKGYKHRVGHDTRSTIITVSDGKDVLYICRRNRLWLYKNGIADRIERLKRAYLLHRLPDNLTGSFFDCGANIGELGIFSRQSGFDYHAFEPEDREADCCDLNNFRGETRTNRVGLWSQDGMLTFYSKPSTGDSSIFEMEDYVEKTEIPVRSLDSITAETGLSRIAVLKVEAEGAEPEILKGATETLKSTSFVTVDCGFERGLKKESTLVPVLNFMADANFHVVDWNPGRTCFLFQNRRI
jgi:FkbM family methyltransferase